MKTTLRFVLLLCVAASLPALRTAHAQEAGLAFLRLGTNAEALALGDAHVAHSRDAFATYWNPAGLAAASSNSAAISHHLWLADVRTYAAAARFGVGQKGGLGVFLTATGSSGLEAREVPGDPDGLFSAQFVSLGAAYGRQFGPLRAGVTAKYLSEQVYFNDASGFALDAGLQLDLWQNGLQLGAALQNVGEMSELSVQSTPLPRLVRAGAAVFPFRILTSDDDAPLFNLMVTGEVSHLVPAEMTRVHVGVAGEVLEMLTLRLGYLSNDAVRRFSFGAGLGYESLAVDYAFLPFQQEFDGPGHVLTVGYRW